MADSVYNLVSGGHKYGGPYRLEELAKLLDEGEITLESLCLCVGDDQLLKVGELLEFVDDSEVEEEFTDEEDDQEEEDEAELEELFQEVDWEDGVWLAEDEDEEEEAPSAVASASPSLAKEWDPDDVIIRLHPSIFGYPKLLLMVLTLSGVAALFLFLGPLVGLPVGQLTNVLIGSACFALIWLLFLRHFDNYIVTRARAEVVRGIIAKSSNEVRVPDVRRIDVDKKGLLGLLNVGDVKLSSAGTGGFDVVFANVRAGHKLKKILRRVQKDPHAPRKRLLHGKSWLRR